MAFPSLLFLHGRNVGLECKINAFYPWDSWFSLYARRGGGGRGEEGKPGSILNKT